MRVKAKTKKAAAKRFRVTGTGKVKFKRAGKRHLLSNKSSKGKRQLRGPGYLESGDVGLIERTIPYLF